MSQAETAAKVASLRHLGYSVPATPVGAVIAGTFPGTPAYGVLNVGDVIYEIRNGTGVGVGAPQYGLRRTILAGVSQHF